MTAPYTCPDPATLQRFLNSQLDAAASGRVEEHLAACEACVVTLEAAQGAVEGCPVSKALKAVDITLDARLEK